VQAVLLVAYLVVAATAALSPEHRSVLSCLLMLQAAVYAGRCAARVGVRTQGREHRLAWRLLATGCLTWALTQAFWTWMEVFDAAPPVLLDAAGMGYAALPLLALPALRLLVTSRSARGGLLVRLLDALALSGAVVILGWTLALEEALRQQHTFPLVFAVGDVAIAVAVVALLARFAGAVTRPVSLAASGLLVVATTDITYVGQALRARTSPAPGSTQAGWSASCSWRSARTPPATAWPRQPVAAPRASSSCCCRTSRSSWPWR